MLILFDLACVAFFFSLVLSPLVRRVAIRFGLVDKPDNERKLHARPVPRVGGIAIALAYSLTLLFVLVAPYQNLLLDIPRALHKGVALIPAAAVVFLTGLLDDIYGLRPWQKLTGQTVAAVWAFSAGFGISILRDHQLETVTSLAVTVLWLVACSNAMNLIDGMDGLAAGVGFFASATTLVAALTHDNLELALVTAPLAGSLLGFLRYNFNPASIFLGDCGSLLVGFLLGCYGALWSHKSATILGMTAPLMALAIPLLDASVAVLRRFLRGQQIFSADRGHIHHRLLDLGLTPRSAVLLLYAGCGIAAALSLLHDLADNRVGGLVIVLFCAAAWIGIQHLGYAEFGVAGRLLFKGALRSIIDVQIRLQQFERALGTAATVDDLWETIKRGCGEFDFVGVRMNYEGRIYEHPPGGQTNRPSWQLRIPLSGNQYVNFFRDLKTAMHPIALARFAEIVERVIREKSLPAQRSASKHSGRSD